MQYSTHGTREFFILQWEVIIIISIDLKDPRPIFKQVRDGLKKLIICGILKPDEKIPSVREMAQNLAINPNTIQKAYRDLEAEGYVYQVTGKGTFVASTEPGENSEKIEQLLLEVLKLARELIYLGISKEEIVAAVESL
ncbi:GntR family transcriptional regulator [Syntrophomonas wolfei]|uniref:GntR family transcriptional regulator n=1 Tax=Syntrophomonas wolfei TaxID=863 RepID=UPI0023F0FD66|nr:GntR family transcriptional regulator [Syntrophomonas wolfei]